MQFQAIDRDKVLPVSFEGREDLRQFIESLDERQAKHLLRRIITLECAGTPERLRVWALT
jgi:hypothetical protein